jgi:hypothetical protein
VTEAEFRKIALSLPETFEKSHVGHPDFRVRFAGANFTAGGRKHSKSTQETGDSVSGKPKGGKIFATLGYPDERFAVLILTPDQQGELIGRYPEMFEPVKNKWGKRGSTQVVLKAARPNLVESAMKLAWNNARRGKAQNS